MKKYLIIFCLFLSSIYAQNGNHIHHLYGLSEPTQGLFKMSALNQQADRNVEIETFSLNFDLGGEYFYNTISNNVYFEDTTSQQTIAFLNSYLLPEIYTSNHAGLQNPITFQTPYTNLCMDPQSDTTFYTFNANDSILRSMNFNQAQIGASPSLSLINDENKTSLVYYNNTIYLSGSLSIDEFILYEISSTNLNVIDTASFFVKDLKLISHSTLGVFAIAQNGLDENYLLRYQVNQNQFDTIGQLPSCQNCATETFSYDKNAIVIDAEKEHLIVSRTETVAGNETYFLSTYSLIDANEIYNIETAEKWSNLILQKPMDGLVYPGDANHDKVVNMLDILPIGLKYNDLVNARLEISTEWIGQEATNTNDTLANGVDKKHADSNGDGQINALDYDNAIPVNFSYLHNSEKSTSAACQFPLFVNFPSVIKEGEDVQIEIGLDLSTDALQDVYGVVFTIEYDSNFVLENTLNTQGVNTWFGTENGNFIQRNQDNYNLSKMDVGVVGIDKLNRNGGGVLLQGIWTMEDDVIPISQQSGNMYFRIKDVVVIDFEENELDACGLDTVIKVYDKTVGLKERETLSLEIYPNPTKANFINLAHVSELESVEIYDLQGKLVKTWFSNFENLNIQEFSKGVYILKAYADEKVYINKLVLDKE